MNKYSVPFMALGLLSFSPLLVADMLHYLQYRPVRTVIEEAAVLAEQIEEKVQQPTEFVLISFDEVAPLINSETRPGHFIDASAVFYPEAIANGWTPILRYVEPIRMGIYQLDESRELIKTIATPPKESLAAAIARNVLGDDYEYVETLDHNNCLRTLVTGRADACVARERFAAEYQDKINIPISLAAGPFLVPPALVLASPDTSPADVAKLSQGNLDAIFKYQPFTDADHRWYQRLELLVRD